MDLNNIYSENTNRNKNNSNNNNQNYNQLYNPKNDIVDNHLKNELSSKRNSNNNFNNNNFNNNNNNMIHKDSYNNKNNQIIKLIQDREKEKDNDDSKISKLSKSNSEYTDKSFTTSSINHSDLLNENSINNIISKKFSKNNSSKKMNKQSLKDKQDENYIMKMNPELYIKTQKEKMQSINTNNNINNNNNKKSSPNIPLVKRQTTNNSQLLSRRDSLYKLKPKSKIERDIVKFTQLSNRSKKKLISRINFILFVIDIAILSLTCLMATILYFDHFDYIHNDYELTDQSNQIRIVCFLGSLMQVILLIIRDFNLRTVSNVKLFLNYTKMPNLREILNTEIIIEIIIHLLQPIPFITYKFDIIVLGGKVIYSLNMIMFCLCVIRFYYFFFVINKWLVFSSEQAKRILLFLQGKTSFSMTFKSIIKYYGLYSLMIFFLFMTYFFSLIFKIMEDFDPDGKNKGFNYLVNCLWYIIVTMTSIGYGDFSPVTLIGRIIGVLCCIVGIFFIAIIFVFLVLYTSLEEDELRVSYII